MVAEVVIPADPNMAAEVEISADPNMVAEVETSADPNMVAEIVNYSVVPISTQPKETCVKPEILVFNALPGPHMDKNVFSFGMISSTDKPEDMEKTPPAQNSTAKMPREFPLVPPIARTPKVPEFFSCKGLGKDFQHNFLVCPEFKRQRQSLCCPFCKVG